MKPRHPRGVNECHQRNSISFPPGTITSFLSVPTEKHGAKTYFTARIKNSLISCAQKTLQNAKDDTFPALLGYFF